MEPGVDLYLRASFEGIVFEFAVYHFDGIVFVFSIYRLFRVDKKLSCCTVAGGFASLSSFLS